MLLHFMQVMRTSKKNNCSLTQKHQEVSVLGPWALWFSPLFSLGWFLYYSEGEGGGDLTFFHPHLFQFSISICTCSSSTAEDCCIPSWLRTQTQPPLEKKIVKMFTPLLVSLLSSITTYAVEAIILVNT